jgi:hypothetical protein
MAKKVKTMSCNIGIDCDAKIVNAINSAPEGTFNDIIPDIQVILEGPYETPEEIAQAIWAWIKRKIG